MCPQSAEMAILVLLVCDKGSQHEMDKKLIKYQVGDKEMFLDSCNGHFSSFGRFVAIAHNQVCFWVCILQSDGIRIEYGFKDTNTLYLPMWLLSSNGRWM
jgi:hypothetical protein